MVAGLPAERGYMEQTLAGKISLVTVIATDIDGAAVEDLAASSDRITGKQPDVLDAGAVDGGWSI